MTRLCGAVVPMITPFDGEGNLDLDMVEHNVLRWNHTSVHGYMCLGSNGEARSLSETESRDVVRAVMDARNADKPVLAGVGRESLALTMAAIEAVAPFEPDYVSVLTPGYFRSAMTGSALADYYTAVADRSPIPVVLYVAPAFANSVTLAPDVVTDLAGHPNIHGIKDGSSSLLEYLPDVAHRQDFAVLAGTLKLARPALGLGADGAVLSAANYLPDRCAEAIDLHRGGHTSQALQAFERLADLVASTAGPLGVPGVKACAEILGWRAGPPRSPLRQVAPAQRAALETALETALKGLR